MLDPKWFYYPLDMYYFILVGILQFSPSTNLLHKSAYTPCFQTLQWIIHHLHMALLETSIFVGDFAAG